MSQWVDGRLVTDYDGIRLSGVCSLARVVSTIGNIPVNTLGRWCVRECISKDVGWVEMGVAKSLIVRRM